ncbi:MAG: ABC-type Mn2+/Zn2+ transporter [Micavibrio sp.]|nr:ABC-type Mn2+/Zn2+ transporter [Micavibrio sp.]
MHSLFTFDMLKLLAPALAAGYLVALTHVPLGREVLNRGIVFLDLAVAQVAGLGAVMASALFDWSGPMAQIPAFIAAMLAALIFSKLERFGQTIQEACIGCAFVLAASLAILMFAGDPHAGEGMSSLLAGQILWVQWPSLLVAGLIYVLIAGCLFLYPVIAQRHFYALFALSITLSVQLVGVYLVFASLILPALVALNRPGRQGLLVGYAVSAAAVTGGLIVSVISDLPSGPVLVCSYITVAVVIYAFKRLNMLKFLIRLLNCCL